MLCHKLVSNSLFSRFAQLCPQQTVDIIHPKGLESDNKIHNSLALHFPVRNIPKIRQLAARISSQPAPETEFQKAEDTVATLQFNQGDEPDDQLSGQKYEGVGV